MIRVAAMILCQGLYARDAAESSGSCRQSCFRDAQGIDQLSYAHKDAELFFANLLRSGRLGSSFPPGSIRTTLDADYATTREVLKQAINSAVSGETLFTSISGQGLAFPSWDQGYIAAKDTQSEKPQSTAISIRELRGWIEASAAAQIWLFADLCRQSEGRRENRINYRLESELKELAPLPFGAVLATAEKQQSEERDSLVLRSAKATASSAISW